MDEACNLKLQRLQIVQQSHHKRISKIEQAVDDIKQIKWMIAGGLIFFVAEQSGFITAIEKLIM